MSLTVAAEGTGATVSDPGSREHTHRPIVFGASLLWRERGPLPTPQRAVRLRKKVLPSQAAVLQKLSEKHDGREVLLPVQLKPPLQTGGRYALPAPGCLLFPRHAFALS